MVKIVSGNLLDAKEDRICHQVNCQGVMNSGVAKAIRDKWHGVYYEYENHCYERGSMSLLGTVQYISVERGRDVVNMFSQNDYGYDGRRYTSYDAFYKCLETIAKDNPDDDVSFAFPYKIGCDRGGASWNVIYAMICDVLGDRDVTIYKLEETR